MLKIKEYLEKNAVLRHGISLLVLILCYSPILSTKPTVNPDAHLIIPQLNSFYSLQEYFESLITFKLYDFQPVRDLSIYLDWKIFEFFGINTFVVHNLLIWFLSCLVIEKIIFLTLKDITKLNVWLSIILFSIYPLFCSTIAWGIARKHLLSFLFICFATYYFILSEKNNFKKLKFNFFFNISYALSVFSQPISILWPFWVIIYLLLKGEKKNSIFKNIYPSFLIFLTSFFCNFFYYRESKTFFKHFESKISDPFNFPDKFLAIGHYLFQLFLPLWPSSSYELGHYSVWIGIILSFIIYFLIRYQKCERNIFIKWISFSLLPIFVVTTNPNLLFDSYLLIPSLGFFVLILKLYFDTKKNLEKSFLITTILLFFFFIIKTNYESRFWLNPIKYALERGFRRRPNCSNAINASRKTYSLNQKLPDDLKNYLNQYDCFNLKSVHPSEALSFVYFQSYVLFFENDLDINSKISSLDKFSYFNWYPKILSIALLIKNKSHTEAIKRINNMSAEFSKIVPEDRYDSIIAEIVLPFCKENNLNICYQFSQNFSKEVNLPYL